MNDTSRPPEPDPADPALRRLLDEARLLRRVAHNVPVAIAYYENDSFRCRFANTGYARMFGFDEQSILGRTVAEVIGADAAALIQPRVDRVIQDREPSAYEREISGPDGEPHTIEVTLVPHLDGDGRRVLGAFVLIADITRHRRTERQLRESEDRLGRFMQATAEGIVFHRGGYITDANPPLLALIGYTLDELRGRHTLEFIAPAERARVASVQVSGAETRYESAVLHRDGSTIPVEFIVRTMQMGGETQRMTIVRDLRETHAAQARIRHLASHDGLTGLPNRAEFIERMSERLAAAQTTGAPLALLFIDLDHFKRVNDSLGHLAGDRLLQQVAGRITARLRASDLVARFGGDEFMVLLGGDLDRSRAADVAGKLVAAVSETMDVQGATISVTPSIGIAMFPEHGSGADELIQHADTAMYHAKSSGRAGHRFFEPAMAARVYDELLMEGRLTQALALDEFELHYQPQLDAVDDTVVAVEALLRWRDPERGLIEPEQFIALAESRRLMLPIGRWVLARALADAACWRRAALVAGPVAVNLSTLEFTAADFAETVLDALRSSGLPGPALEIELTERMLMDDLDAVRPTIERLKAAGVRIAIDDFGTGYTSLVHLRDLPLDRLKLDRSFVRDLPGHDGSAAIARAIIQLGAALGLAVVAEGVETDAQREWLLAQGCAQLQGRLLGAPLPAAAFEAWLQARAAPR